MHRLSNRQDGAIWLSIRYRCSHGPRKPVFLGRRIPRVGKRVSPAVSAEFVSEVHVSRVTPILVPFRFLSQDPARLLFRSPEGFHGPLLLPSMINMGRVSARSLYSAHGLTRIRLPGCTQPVDLTRAAISDRVATFWSRSAVGGVLFQSRVKLSPLIMLHSLAFYCSVKPNSSR